MQKEKKKTTRIYRDFPGSLVVKTSPSNARRVGLIPGQGAKKPKHKTEAIL